MLYKKILMISEEELEISQAFVTHQRLGQGDDLPSFFKTSRNITNYDYIIIDTGLCRGTEVDDSVKLLSRITKSPVILIVDNQDYNYLRECKFAYTGDKLLKEIEDIILDRNDYIKGFSSQNPFMVGGTVDVPSDLVFRIGVSGSIERIGTTTQVFALYNYLKKLGFKPQIIDPTQHIQLNQRDGFDVSISAEEFPGYNVYIYDFKKDVENLDLNFIVIGTEPVEVTRYTYLRQKEYNHRLLVSFSDDVSFERLKNQATIPAVQIPYRPDIANNDGDYLSQILNVHEDILNA